MQVSNTTFLAAMADDAQSELRRHRRQRREWSFHEILNRAAIAELAARDPIAIDPETASCFMGNLIVEKGLAEYDRIVSAVLQSHPVFREWKDTWVAEEEPHGAALLEWAKVRGLIDPSAAQDAIAGLLKNGLSLSCSNAPSMLAYGALQEAATRLTHKGVKDRLPTDELHGRRILSNIIADEDRHERFYANMVRHALNSGDRDVVSAQVSAIADVVRGFEMPGIERDVVGAQPIINAYRSTGVFTLKQLVKNVLLPAIDHRAGDCYGWNLEEIGPLATQAEQDRDALRAFAQSLRQGPDTERAYLVALGRARRDLHAAQGW